MKDHFRRVGEVAYANVMSDYSGRSKGCGVVEFANKDDVQAAIDTMNGSVLDGREISCREDRPPPEGGSSRDRRRDGPPRDREPREPRGDRDRNTDNPELEKKMDDDLDNYFANKPADEEGAPTDGAEPAPADEAAPTDAAAEPAN